MNTLELMIADAKAAQARQRKIWAVGHEYNDGGTVSVYDTTPRKSQPRPSEVTPHAISASAFDIAYNPSITSVY